MKKVILAGGSGYIGSVLAEYLAGFFDEIVILSRNARPAVGKIRTLAWDARTIGAWATELDGAELLVNLTGKNVNCRYNEKNKAEILNSRVDSVRVLEQACQSVLAPPHTWIQLGSATIYRHAEERAMDESTGEIGQGFSVEVCKAWEKTFWNTNLPQTRKVLLRTTIVLGKRDGVIPRLVNLVRFGLGGKQGNGNQMISWIHDHDLARMVLWIYENKSIEGTYNAASPNPVTNRVFMNTLRQHFGTPIGLPAPAWLLKIGAWMIGTETELILKSRWVIPTKLQQAGFSFKFGLLDNAVKDVLSSPE